MPNASRMLAMLATLTAGVVACAGPPMLDPADACPDDPAPDTEDRDGCPEPSPGAGSGLAPK